MMLPSTRVHCVEASALQAYSSASSPFPLTCLCPCSVYKHVDLGYAGGSLPGRTALYASYPGSTFR